jgi:hypothetical protein
MVKFTDIPSDDANVEQDDETMFQYQNQSATFIKNL